MSADLQKGERYQNLDFLLSYWISMDASFRVKKITGSTLTSTDIEVEADEELPALISVVKENCCSHHHFCTRPPRLILSKL